MLDPKQLRSDVATVAKALSKRGFVLDADQFNAFEVKRRDLQQKTQDLQAQRNTNAKAVGQAKARGEDIEPLRKQVADIGDELKSNEAALNALQGELDYFQLSIPNLLP